MIPPNDPRPPIFTFGLIVIALIVIAAVRLLNM